MVHLLLKMIKKRYLHVEEARGLSGNLRVTVGSSHHLGSAFTHKVRSQRRLQLLSEEGSGNTVSGQDVLKRYLKLSNATFCFCFCLCSGHSRADDTKCRPQTKSIINGHNVANQNFFAGVSVQVRVIHFHWTTVLSVFG